VNGPRRWPLFLIAAPGCGRCLLGPAVATAAELLHVLIIVLVVLAVVAGGGLVAPGTWRLRQTRPDTPRVVHRATPVLPRSPPLSAPQPPAIERTHEVHLHLHGISAQDIAAIFDQRKGVNLTSLQPG